MSDLCLVGDTVFEMVTTRDLDLHDSVHVQLPGRHNCLAENRHQATCIWPDWARLGLKVLSSSR